MMPVFTCHSFDVFASNIFLVRPTGISGVNRYIATPKYKSRRGTWSSAVLCPRHTHGQDSELLVHGRYGEIRSRYPYGHSLDPPKGWTGFSTDLDQAATRQAR